VRSLLGEESSPLSQERGMLLGQADFCTCHHFAQRAFWTAVTLRRAEVGQRAPFVRCDRDNLVICLRSELSTSVVNRIYSPHAESLCGLWDS